MSKKIIVFVALILLIALGSLVYFYLPNNTNIQYENEFNKLNPEERDSIRTQDIEQLKIALEFYYEDKGEYPLTNGVEKIIDNKNSLVNALSPDYLLYNQQTYNSFPIDPLPPERDYTYESDGNSYTIIVNSETKGTIETSQGTSLNAQSQTSSFNVDFTDYYLSVDAYNANLIELLNEISSKTGVKIEADDIPKDYTISINLQRRGFTLGMKDLVAKIKPGQYEGDFQLGRTFSESVYSIRKMPDVLVEQKTDSAEYYNLKGEGLLAENKLDEAYSSFISALISDPRYLPAHKNLILVYSKQERYSGMIERAQKIISLEPSNAENYKILADAYRLNCQYGNSLKNYVISFDMTNNKEIEKEIINNIENIKRESWKKDCSNLQK